MSRGCGVYGLGLRVLRVGVGCLWLQSHEHQVKIEDDVRKHYHKTHLFETSEL